MKTKMLSLLRHSAFPVLGICAVGLFGACGGETTNPDVKTLDELKFAKGLTITDKGNGTVQLAWLGTNSEDDLTAALKAADLSEGSSLQLLNDEGEARDAAKAILQEMSYNGTDFEKPAAAAENPDSEDIEFQFYPVYKTKDVFPTCQPKEKVGSKTECVGLTAEGTAQNFVGSTWYNIEGLTPGSKYCFLILSTLDGGKTVAMTSSELRCITPKVKATDLDVSLINATSKNQTIDLEKTRDACTASGCTVAPTKVTFSCDANDVDTGESLCLEIFSGNPGFTGGDYVVVNDLGYYANGFEDQNLPKAPALPTYIKGAIAYKGGYGPSGQTLPILAKHMYVIAHRSSDSDNEPTSFYYDWYYVKSVTSLNTTDADVSFEIRIAKATGIE